MSNKHHQKDRVYEYNNTTASERISAVIMLLKTTLIDHFPKNTHPSSTLPNKIVIWEKKLMQLRTNQSSLARPSLFWSKYTIKHHIFTYFTLLLIVSLVGLNLISASLRTVNNIEQSTPAILDKISFLLEYTSAERSQVLQNIESDILLAIRPITDITITEAWVQNDLRQATNLVDLWLDKIQLFDGYTFGPEGVVHILPNKSFTSDLESFFQDLPLLIEQTQQAWSDFWHYRWFMNTFGDQNIKNILSSIQEILKLLPIIESHQQDILDLLGHFSTKQIVIFNQNTGEARSTGGFYGSYLPLTISQAQIDIGQSQSIYWIDGSKDVQNLAHPAYSYYSYGRDQTSLIGARDLNFTPCFDITGKVIEQEFSSSDNGYTIDHLIMITPNLIQSLLPEGFVLNVEGIGTINKENFLNEVERLTSLSFRTNSNPKANISNIFKALINSFSDIVSQQGLTSIINVVIDSIQSRDTMLWFRQNRQQNLFKSLGLGSDQVCYSKDKEDFITPILMNFSGDKRNLVSSNTFALSSSRGFGKTNFTLKYQEYIPPKTFLQRNFNSLTGQMLIGVQLPSSSSDFAIVSDDAINRTLVKPFSEFYVPEQFSNFEIKELPEIAIINQSARSIPGGFVYTQADGSTVLASFITSQAGYNEVEFNFSLPLGSYEPLTFYGQPGVNDPALSLGKGVRSVSLPNESYFSDPQFIQKGIRVYTH